MKADPKILWDVDVLSAEYLSGQMLARERKGLNTISHDSASALIRKALDKGVNLQEVFVDTVGDAGRYQELLSKRFPGVTFVVCPKADSIYPIVSAASIAAKVTRDHGIKNWTFEQRLSPTTTLGSGYPADPYTIAWLHDNLQPLFMFPKIVRFSWGTLKQYLDTTAVGVEWEADQEDDVRTNQKLTFGGIPVGQQQSAAPQRHPYFKSRKMQRVTCF